MARITTRAWNNYITILRRIDDRASKEMRAMITKLSARYEEGAITLEEYEDAVIDYAYALATKYGEAAGTAACEMYDAISELQGANVPPAVPAPTATMAETAKTVKGTMKTGNPDIVAQAAGRLCKQAGADTMLQNAKRDGAYFAWVAHGDTCAYCLALAGLGWQKAGDLTLKGGHAEHIHANCDCTYAIDHKGDLEVAGYDPSGISKLIESMTDGEYDAEKLIKAAGRGKRKNYEGLNDIRRKFYAENKEIINEQKRSAYEKRMERNSSAAEEINVD